MKRTIYSLAFLPFIAFGVKTVADEGSLCPPSAMLVAASSDRPSMADMDKTVQQTLASSYPNYWSQYQSLTPNERMLVYKAIMTAPYGQEAARACSVIDAIDAQGQIGNNGQPMVGGSPQDIVFEESPTTTPAQKANAMQQPQSGTPAAVADMQMQQSGADMSNSPASQADEEDEIEITDDNQGSGW